LSSDEKEDEEEWPKGFEQETPSSYKIDVPLRNTEDVTRSSMEELQIFSPYIVFVGIDIYGEAKENPRTVFYRALESQSGVRCLQYIFTFKKQKGIIEPYTLAGILFQTLVLWGSICLIMGQCVIGISLFSWISTEIRFDMSVLFLISAILGIYEMCYGLKRRWSQIPLLSAGILTLFITIWECVLLCLLVFDLGIFFLFLCESREKGVSFHKNDFAPVFVWIRKNSEGHQWTFEKAVWDKFHYSADCFRRNDVSHEELSLRLRDNSRIMLKIDNLWHAFSQISNPQNNIKSSGRKKGIFLYQYLIKIAIVCIALPFFISALFFWLVFQSLALFVICFNALLIVAFYNLIYTKEKIDPKERLLDLYFTLTLNLSTNYLTHKKLKDLWNHNNKESRLKIITKMQNPFSADPDCFKSFCDPLCTRLARLIPW
jgi:hypothetical protein